MSARDDRATVRSPDAQTLINRRRLASLARELWLPKDATRAQVARAIRGLSAGPRRDDLARRLASIPEDS